MSTLPSEDEVRSVVATVVERLTADASAAPDARARASATQDDSARVEVALGSDHGGFFLKKRIADALREKNVEVRDCGTHGSESVDYPDFAHAVARLVADGGARWGIVIDGAGIGSCMVANKVPGIRAATSWDISSARNSREHNHANVLVLGAGLIGDNLALQIVEEWMSTPWGGGRHARRVDQISEIERRYLAHAEAGALR